MELIFSNQYYNSDEREIGKCAKELVSNLSEFDDTVKAENRDIGHGADWPVVLVQIFNNFDWTFLTPVAGMGVLFLLGEKINKNIDGWIQIGKKLKKVVEKFRPVRIDENAATLMVLNDLLGKEGKSTTLSVSLQIIEFTPMPWGKGGLDKRPDVLYLITVRTVDEVIVYGVKSNCNIEFKHRFGTHWSQF